MSLVPADEQLLEGMLEDLVKIQALADAYHSGLHERLKMAIGSYVEKLKALTDMVRSDRTRLPGGIPREAAEVIDRATESHPDIFLKRLLDDAVMSASDDAARRALIVDMVAILAPVVVLARPASASGAAAGASAPAAVPSASAAVPSASGAAGMGAS